MIAPFGLLHRCRTFRAVLDVKLAFEPPECLVAAGCNVFVLGARVVAMSFMTRGADRFKTVSTGVRWRFPVRGYSTTIDVATIRRRAAAKGLGATSDVFFEGRLEDGFEDGRRKMGFEFL